MSREVFDQNGAQIVTAVRLLLADSKRRSRFQLAAVYEKGTNELLAEVLLTGFGPVVVYSTQVGTLAKHKPGKEGVPLHLRQHRNSRPIMPLTDEADQVFSVMSRSNTSYEITGAELRRIIAGDADPRTFRFAGDEAGELTFRVSRPSACDV